MTNHRTTSTTYVGNTATITKKNTPPRRPCQPPPTCGRSSDHWSARSTRRRPFRLGDGCRWVDRPWPTRLASPSTPLVAYEHSSRLSTHIHTAYLYGARLGISALGPGRARHGEEPYRLRYGSFGTAARGNVRLSFLPGAIWPASLALDPGAGGPQAGFWGQKQPRQPPGQLARLLLTGTDETAGCQNRRSADGQPGQ